jgi:hypothetical protein
MEGYSYYLEKLKSNKAMCYMFGRIPIPPGIPFIFTISTIVVASLIEIAFPTFFILPILFIIVCFEHYSIVQLKSYILEECIYTEGFFQMDLIKNGVGEWEEDSLNIDDNDREDILEEVIYITFSEGKNKFAYKIKNHYQFLITIVTLFVVIYFFFRFLFSS